MRHGHIITIPQLTLQLHFRDFQEKAKKVKKPKVEIREPSEEEEVVVTIEKPPAAEPTYTTWKSARIFPMIFKKVRGLADRRGVIDLEDEEWQRRLEAEDKDYLKLTLDQEEATESTVESEEESSSDYTEYSEEESEFSESETTEESESETPSEEEESSTPESEESTESEGEKARKNIFLARRRPIAEEVQKVKDRKEELPEEPEERNVEEEEERPAEQESELAPVEEPTDLESQDITEEGSAESASVEGGVESEEESESSMSSSSSESQSGGPWGFQVPEYDPSKQANEKKPPGASSEGYNTAL